MGALSDPQVKKYVSSKFVCTFEQVGTFEASRQIELQPKFGTRRTKAGGCFMSGEPADAVKRQGGNVVTYFCTPDMKVIHFVVGPVGPVQLRAAAEWAVGVHASATTKQAPPDWDQLRALHSRETPLAVSTKFKVEYQKSLDAAKSLDADHKLLIKVAQNYGRRANSWLSKWSNFSRTSATAHLILSSVAGCPLQDIEAGVFEQLAGEVFRPRDDRERLVKTVRTAIAEGRPVVLVIASVPFGFDDVNATANGRRVRRQNIQRLIRINPHLESVGVSQLVTPDARIWRRLIDFRVLRVSPGEATTLSDELGHGVLPKWERARIHALALGRDGRRVGMVVKSHNRFAVLFAGETKEPDYQKELANPFRALLGRAIGETSLLGLHSPNGLRRFSSSDHQYTVLARTKSVKDQTVTLTRRDGKVLKVPLSRFCEADQAFLKRFEVVSKRNKERLTKHSQSQAIASAKRGY